MYYGNIYEKEISYTTTSAATRVNRRENLLYVCGFSTDDLLLTVSSPLWKYSGNHDCYEIVSALRCSNFIPRKQHVSRRWVFPSSSGEWVGRLMADVHQAKFYILLTPLTDRAKRTDGGRDGKRKGSTSRREMPQGHHPPVFVSRRLNCLTLRDFFPTLGVKRSPG